MRRDEVIGAWRLVSLTRGGPVITSQTHLVVRKDVLWEVWPDSTYYEGEEGPENRYRLKWKGDEGFLEVLRPRRPSFCGILRIEKNELRIRWGGIAGKFPKSFDEDYGLLAVFVRETKNVAKISEPPARVKRTTRRHRTLGDLAYDDDLGWWSAKVSWGKEKDVQVYVTAPLDCKDAVFDRAAERLKTVRCSDAKAYAASKLLALKNESWLGDDEKPLSAAKFRARLSPQSFTVEERGDVNVCFNDGDLFWGHVVMVQYDTKLRAIDAEIAG